jgi:hypothetical protein
MRGVGVAWGKTQGPLAHHVEYELGQKQVLEFKTTKIDHSNLYCFYFVSA